jgi:ribonuclease HI
MQYDREGSAVLEHLLKREDLLAPRYDLINLKELVSVACWYMWWMRRQRTHNEDVPPLFKCIHYILSITSNAARACKKDGLNRMDTWSKPEPRHIKLIVDASFYLDSRACVVGAVLRDYQGSFIAANCSFIPHVASVAMAEAIAMREGLGLAATMGCNALIAESDSVEVIEACTGEAMWWSDSAAIYADILDATTTIDKVIFKHCSREANKVAHDLAKYSFSSKLSCKWVDEPPGFLLNNLVNDATIL